MSQSTTNLYRDALERWHRCKQQFPALEHDALFPRSCDYGVEDHLAEQVQFEVAREFERSTP